MRWNGLAHRVGFLSSSQTRQSSSIITVFRGGIDPGPRPAAANVGLCGPLQMGVCPQPFQWLWITAGMQSANEKYGRTANKIAIADWLLPTALLNASGKSCSRRKTSVPMMLPNNRRTNPHGSETFSLVLYHLCYLIDRNYRHHKRHPLKLAQTQDLTTTL